VPPASLPPADPPSGPTDLPCEPASAGTAGLLVEVDVLRRTVARIGDELTGLRRAMASRSVIDQAKGAVRAVTGLSGDEAFALLAARSQNANRKLSDVASDVLASTDPDSRGTPVLGALQLPDPRGEPGPAPTAWRSRRRVDPVLAAVTDDAHLRALAELGGMLAAAASRADVVHVLLCDGAEALGAFGAVVASLTGTGTTTVETAGGALVDREPRPISMADDHPLTAVLRTRTSLVLSRADLALRYPEHPRPQRLAGIAVLPVATDTADALAWSLYFDHVLPPHRSLRAMLESATRMATGALARAG
jgi:hypothetical protein